MANDKNKLPDSLKDIDLNNPEFKQVEALINYTDTSVFMTGKAGTGKSTFLKYITATTRKKYVVLAPTGIAAVNAGGQTLHSFFHIPLKPILAQDPEFNEKNLRNRMKFSSKFVKLLRSLDLIIIDEISMVRADVIDFIDKLLRFYCRRSDLPFGGKQLLMVGDIYQLEPVVTAQAREILRHEYTDFFFFSAKAFAGLGLVPIELRKVYRQSDSDFIGLLDRVRAGRPTPADINAINARVNHDAATAEAGSAPAAKLSMTIATRREIVDYINESHLARIAGKPAEFEADIDGDFPESSFPTDKRLLLKKGAQVVFIRNDPERRWVNGTLGRIHAIRSEKLEIELENGDIHTVEPEVWGNVEYQYDPETKGVSEHVKGSFRQFPVKLAWALTIHKSQGLTFSNVIIDVGAGAFTGGQTYVALSRCTSLEGITMATPLRQSDVYVNPAVLRFAAGFNNPTLVNMVMERARADALYADASAAFAKGDFALAVDLFGQAEAIKPILGDSRARRIIVQKLHSLSAPVAEAERLRTRLGALEARMASLAREFAALGRSCLDDGWDHAPAMANFRKAIDLDPHCYEAIVGLGRAHIAAGDSDSAREVLGRAAREYPGYEAPYELGCLLFSEGCLEDATRMLRKAQKANPKIPEIHDALADVYEALDNPAQAKRHRDQAARLRKNK